MKTLMSILALIGACISINAQKGLELGIEGTPQLTMLVNYDDRGSHFDYLPTIKSSLGISSKYNFTPNMGIGLNVLYSFQGQKFKYFGMEREKRVQYLKIPIMYTYNFDINPKCMLIGKIGPQVGILTNAKIVDQNGNDIVSDQSQAYRKADFGGVITGGLAYKLTQHICVDASVRLDAGFTNAEDNDYVTHINDPLFVPNGEGEFGLSTNRAKTYNFSTGITVGFRYMFGMQE